MAQPTTAGIISDLQAIEVERLELELKRGRLMKTLLTSINDGIVELHQRVEKLEPKPEKKNAPDPKTE